jgi:hypothetical protein
MLLFNTDAAQKFRVVAQKRVTCTLVYIPAGT